MNVTFDELYRNYSSSDMSRSSYVGQRDLFTQIGWEMYLGNPNYENTCALRVSLAFLGAGHKISLRSHNILKGPHSGKGDQVNMRKLADLLATPHYLGAYEPFTPETAQRGIGSRKGVVAFNKIPGFSGGGHIDLVLGAIDAAQCASGCYYRSESIWFWPLRTGAVS
ncbi:T6SS effector amidase Tae4 family protein [Brucella cytisi]|uniref:T6SS effector amidase Tae4 family protein n=1 Tax=Brucella cytisi TaxID=407152 RepID=UPI0035DFC5EA